MEVWKALSITVIMLNVVMLSVVMLSVIMLSVMAPCQAISHELDILNYTDRQSKLVLSICILQNLWFN